jgi:GxxExxY protein
MIDKNILNNYSKIIIDSAMDVHKSLGPGLLESVYEECLSYELKSRGFNVNRQYQIPLVYKGVNLNSNLRLDLLVNNEIILELKSVSEVHPIHEAQLLSYLKLSNKWLGLLINFNVVLLKNGIKRIVN